MKNYRFFLILSRSYKISLIFLLILFTFFSCVSKKDSLPVIKLDTYFIYARENGSQPSFPIFPGEVSLDYITDVFESIEQVNKNLNQTYGYEDFELKYETRNLILFEEQIQKINLNYDTLRMDLSYFQQSGQRQISIYLKSYNRRRSMISLGESPFHDRLKTRLTLVPGKVIVLGIGQSETEKRSATFLVLRPEILTIKNEDDLKQMQAQGLSDTYHQLESYELEKKIRQRLNYESRIEEDYENVFNFYEVDDKPRLIEKAPPGYPEKARKDSIQGTVVATIIIKEDGSTGKSSLFRSISAELDSSALAAVKKCKFSPAKKDGKTVKVMMNIPFSFRLQPEESKPFEDPIKEGYAVYKLTRKPVIKEKVTPKIPDDFDKKNLPDFNVVSFLLDEKGNVLKAAIAVASRSKILDQLSLETVKGYKYTPGEIDGKPVQVKLTIAIPYAPMN